MEVEDSVDYTETGLELGSGRKAVSQVAEGEGGGTLGRQYIYLFGQINRTWRHAGCVAWERVMLGRALRLGAQVTRWSTIH